MGQDIGDLALGEQGLELRVVPIEAVDDDGAERDLGRARLLQEPGVEDVRVNVVWSPPWSSDRLTPEGRDALEMWGVAL